MKSLFISYCSERVGIANRLAKALEKRLASESIRISIDIEQTLEAMTPSRAQCFLSSDLILVLVDQALQTELTKENGSVRKGLADAISHDRPILPVLIDGAALHSPEELPPELKGLHSYESASLNSSVNFSADVDRLVATILKLMGIVGKSTAAKQASEQTLSYLSVAARGAAALLSLVGLCALLYVMLIRPDVMADFGLTGVFWFVALMALGVFAALVVFMSKKTYAAWTGTLMGGQGNFRGPVVVMFAVPLMGFILVPEPGLSTFQFTVLVRGPGGTEDIALTKGNVLLRLDGDVKEQSISDNGQAHFVEIPMKFRRENVGVSINSTDFVQHPPQQFIKLEGSFGFAYVKPVNVFIKGTILDQDFKPVLGVRVVAGDDVVLTDADGHFSIDVTGSPSQDRQVILTAEGYLPRTANAVGVRAQHEGMKVQLMRASE